MKPSIHPLYYRAATIQCACGSRLTVGATKEHMEIEICSHCHPFYTGQERMVDTAGRVERYARLMQKSAGKKKAQKASLKGKGK